MKHLFSFIALLLCVASVSAQSGVTSGSKIDTLNAAETLYYYPFEEDSDTLAATFGRGNLYIQIRSDSLSGATNVVTDIQYTGKNAPYDWVTQASGTLTSNGATSQTLIFEDIVFGAGKWRIRSVASGTQATKITKTWVFKRE